MARHRNDVEPVEPNIGNGCRSRLRPSRDRDEYLEYNAQMAALPLRRPHFWHSDRVTATIAIDRIDQSVDGVLNIANAADAILSIFHHPLQCRGRRTDRDETTGFRAIHQRPANFLKPGIVGARIAF
jgi:hypothetical protein